MSKKSKALVSKAKEYRLGGDKENCLATLHQAIEEDPQDINATYLLAATYYELKSVDISDEYCEKILEVDPLHKETLELKAIICEKMQQPALAEEYLLKALEVDPLFYNARYKIIELYFYRIQNYDKCAYQCKIMIENRDPEKMNYSRQKKIKVADTWFLRINNIYISSLIKLKRYREAIEPLKKMIEFGMTYVDYDLGFFHVQEEQIYKLYYLLKDEQGMQEYKNKIYEYMPESSGIIKAYEEEADKGDLRDL